MPDEAYNKWHCRHRGTNIGRVPVLPIDTSSRHLFLAPISATRSGGPTRSAVMPDPTLPSSALTALGYPATKPAMTRHVLAVCLFGIMLLGLGCGESGQRETLPIEVIFYVSGVSGTTFRVESLQAANADHRFGDREFRTPYFFVMENAFQPVSGSFFLPADQPAPITVNLFLGNILRKTVDIQPGTSAPVSEGTPAPKPTGREVRFDVTSVAGAANIGFDVTLGSVGEQHATIFTNCDVRQVAAEFCSTPATFFLEDPRDQVTGDFTKLPGQDADSVFKVDFFLDGRLLRSGSDNEEVAINEFL